MRTRSIPEKEWVEFLDSLTHKVRTQVVTVRVSDPELGYQVEMSQIPLIGVSADLRSSGGPRIEVMVGRTESLHTTHSILRPVAVRLEEDREGTPVVLEVEAKDGSKTLVLLKPVALGEPGTLVERA
jgi:hypothetical protein